MAIYSAYISPYGGTSVPIQDYRLVSDRKAIMALIAPPLWLIWHRLWLELTVYLSVWMMIGLLSTWQPSAALFYLSTLPGLYLLLEGNELIRRKLERNGWEFVGVYNGESFEEAELRFVMLHKEVLQNSVSVTAVKSKPVVHQLKPVGLFPE